MLTSAENIELAREVLKATLRGLIASAGLSITGFATLLGVDESTVRAVLDPDSPTKLLSRTRLEDWLYRLGASKDLQNDLIGLLEAAHQQAQRPQPERRKTEHDLIPTVQRLRLLHDEATHAPDPLLAKPRYLQVATESYSLMDQLDPSTAPVLFVEVCLLAHDTCSILGQPARALAAARRAQHCTQTWEPGRHPGGAMPASEERIGQLMVNSIRAAGLIYRSAGLYDWSQDSAQQALRTMRRHGIREYVVSTASNLDLLHALAGSPRFTLDTADTIARSIEEEVAGHPDGYAEIVRARAWEGLARAYLAYGRLYGFTRVRARKTERLLIDTLTTFKELPSAGPSHRASAFEVMAGYCAAVGDTRGRDEYLSRAYYLAEQAGLFPRIQRIHDLCTRGRGTLLPPEKL